MPAAAQVVCALRSPNPNPNPNHGATPGAFLQVVHLVQEQLGVGADGDGEGSSPSVAKACADVIKVAASRWRQFEGAYRDDISCIVLRLPSFGVLHATMVEGGNVPAASPG